MKRAWSFLGCLQQIGNLAHIPSCSLGSYYLITVELSSPKLCAYKSKPGPRLGGMSCIWQLCCLCQLAMYSYETSEHKAPILSYMAWLPQISILWPCLAHYYVVFVNSAFHPYSYVCIATKSNKPFNRAKLVPQQYHVSGTEKGKPFSMSPPNLKSEVKQKLNLASNLQITAIDP